MLFTREKRLSLLAIGAHPDDIELGAGGLIHRLRRELDARVRFLIFTHGLKSRRPPGDFDPDQRHRESIEAAALLGIEERDVTVLDYPDCGLESDVHSLIRELEGVIDAESFDLVLTHACGDTHLDHKSVHQATVSATRDFDGTVLLYQAPSTIPNEFRPTLFVDLKNGHFEAKQNALRQHVSQRSKSFMAAERVLCAARGWASFFGSTDGVFEAFQVYKSFWC